MFLWDKALKCQKSGSDRQDSRREMIEMLGEYLIYNKIIVLKIFKVLKKGNYFDTRTKGSSFLKKFKYEVCVYF